jgi:hypothetical protein
MPSDLGDNPNLLKRGYYAAVLQLILQLGRHVHGRTSTAASKNRRGSTTRGRGKPRPARNHLLDPTPGNRLMVADVLHHSHNPIPWNGTVDKQGQAIAIGDPERLIAETFNFDLYGMSAFHYRRTGTGTLRLFDGLDTELFQLVFVDPVRCIGHETDSPGRLWKSDDIAYRVRTDQN